MEPPRCSCYADLESAIARDSLSDVLSVLRIRSEIYLTKVPPQSTALHLAALLGHTACMEYLLSKPFYSDQVNHEDQTGCSALMVALREGHFEIVAKLVKSHVCDLVMCNEDGDNILHIAAQTRCKSAPLLVLESAVKQGVNIDKVNCAGITPFLMAIKHYNRTVAQFLYAAGCDINQADVQEGLTSLHYAIKYGFDDITEWLITIGADVNAQSTATLSSPLMFCVQLHRPPHQVFLMLKSLLDRSADPNLQDASGNTCLLLAIANGHAIRKHHIEFLLVSGADPDIPNCHGLTPVWHAIYTGCLQNRAAILALLIRENCAFDTPCRGQLLFHLGSSAVYCYETCLTPLEVALDSCLYDIARVLILAGCHVTSDLAREMAHPGAPPELRELSAVVAMPTSLQHAARLAIRRLLGRPLEGKVRRLPLPDRIKRYVLLEDVLGELDGGRG